jgi:hypothetical protein
MKRIIIDNIDYTDRPQDLPDGTIISYIDGRVKGDYRAVTRINPHFALLVERGMVSDIKIKDIEDEHGNSTHVKRWMVSDRDYQAYLSCYKPIKNEFSKEWIFRGFKLIKNDIKLQYKDEPIEVWVKL